MAARKCSRDEIEEIRNKIIELKAKGYNQTQIASQCGISQQDVSYHWRKIQIERAIRRDKDIEMIRELQCESARSRKRTGWDIVVKTDDPAVQLKTMEMINRADDQINKIYGLYITPPQISQEDALENATIEELTESLSDIFSDGVTLCSSKNGDSPPAPAQLEADTDEEVPAEEVHTDEEMHTEEEVQRDEPIPDKASDSSPHTGSPPRSSAETGHKAKTGHKETSAAKTTPTKKGTSTNRVRSHKPRAKQKGTPKELLKHAKTR